MLAGSYPAERLHQYQYRLVGEGAENSLVEEDLGILVNEELDMSWQRVLTAQKANHVLGCIEEAWPADRER